MWSASVLAGNSNVYPLKDSKIVLHAFTTSTKLLTKYDPTKSWLVRTWWHRKTRIEFSPYFNSFRISIRSHKRWSYIIALYIILFPRGSCYHIEAHTTTSVQSSVVSILPAAMEPYPTGGSLNQPTSTGDSSSVGEQQQAAGVRHSRGRSRESRPSNAGMLGGDVIQVDMGKLANVLGEELEPYVRLLLTNYRGFLDGWSACLFADSLDKCSCISWSYGCGGC